MDNERLYTVKELAASGLLPISRTTIWREIKRGRMPHYRIGGLVFIGTHHIRQYLLQSEAHLFNNSRDMDSDTMAKNSMLAHALNVM